MTTKKRNLPDGHSYIYNATAETEVVESLRSISKSTGLPMHVVVSNAIKYGLPEVKKDAARQQSRLDAAMKDGLL